jgi:hypothetical protein
MDLDHQLNAPVALHPGKNRDPGRCHTTCNSSEALGVVEPCLDTRRQEARKVNAYKVSGVVETSPA